MWLSLPAYVSEPVQMLVLLVRGMAKKPKQLPQPRQVHLPPPVLEGSPTALTFGFRLMSGAVLGSCTVGVPWHRNFEVLSKLLGRDLKLLYIVMTPTLKAHLSKECAEEVGQRDVVHVGALEFGVPGYNEFRSLGSELMVKVIEFQNVTGQVEKATDCFGKAQVRELAPLIFQAFAFSWRKDTEEGRARLPAKSRSWAGCRHSIALRSHRTLGEAISFVDGFCRAHQEILVLISEEIRANGTKTYFA